MRHLSTLVVASSLVLVGCLETTAVECADGRVCPSGTVCDVVSGTCVQPGGLVIAQGVVQLDNVDCGTVAERPMSLGNFGDEPIAFTASSTIENVTITPSSGTIPAGERFEVVLSADATATSLPTGMVEGAIYFTTETEIVPRIVQFTIAGAVIRSSEQVMDFGIASLSALPKPKSFTLHNDGNASVDVSLSLPDAPFSVDVDGPSSIAGDSEESVEVSFAPEFTGTYSSAVGLIFDGPVCQPPPTTLDLSGEISDAAVLVDTTIVDFGTSMCGAGATTRDVTFSSNSAAEETLTLNSNEGSQPQYSTPTEVTLTPGGQQVVSVGRLSVPQPSSTGASSAIVTVTAQPSNVAFDIELRHEIDAPVLGVSSRTVNLGLVPTNGTATGTVAVTNTGTAPALVQVVPPVIATPDGGSVRVEPSSFTLQEGASTNVDVIVEIEQGGFATNGLQFRFESPGQCSLVPRVDVSFFAEGPLMP